MKNKNVVNKEYFQAGKDWYFDRYESVRVQANRWFVGFILSTIMCFLMVIAILTLLPLKTLVPLIVHQNTTTGEFWVDHPKTPYTPANDIEVQADIVRYITSYKSYTAADINQRFHLVMLLSGSNVAKQYEEEQSNNNKNSPVNVLGKDGMTTVRVEDVIFIDKANVHEIRDFHDPSHNLAKVDFTTTTIDHIGNKKIESWVATIGWVYKGLPASQQDAWDNWNGFTVTTFRIDPKNIG